MRPGRPRRLSRFDRTCPYCRTVVPEQCAERHLNACRARAKRLLPPRAPDANERAGEALARRLGLG